MPDLEFPSLGNLPKTPVMDAAELKKMVDLAVLRSTVLRVMDRDGNTLLDTIYAARNKQLEHTKQSPEFYVSLTTVDTLLKMLVDLYPSFGEDAYPAYAPVGAEGHEIGVVAGCRFYHCCHIPSNYLLMLNPDGSSELWVLEAKDETVDAPPVA